MTYLSPFIGIAALLLLCVIPFVISIVVAAFMGHKVGNWYVGKVKSLDKNDLPTFALRNMLFPSLAMLIFVLLIAGYVIFRPKFIDPNWLCFLFAGLFTFIFLFQLFQYLWLHYHTRKKK